MKKGNDKFNIMKAISLFMQLGFTMVVCMLLGLYAGRFLDERLGTAPWLMIVFLLLGGGAAIKVMYDLSKDWK